MFKRNTQFNDSKKEKKDQLRSSKKPRFMRVVAAAVSALALATGSVQAVDLRDWGDEIFVEPVARLALEHPSPEAWSRALALLAERPSEKAQTSLGLALTDPDPSVRETAEALIADWHIMLDDVPNAAHPGHQKQG